MRTFKEPELYSGKCSLTGERSNTKLREILNYIKYNGPTSKYDLVTNVLKKTGSRTKLRGYYCVAFQKMRQSKLLNYDYNTKEYELTTVSIKLVYDKKKYPEYFM